MDDRGGAVRFSFHILRAACPSHGPHDLRPLLSVSGLRAVSWSSYAFHHGDSRSAGGRLGDRVCTGAMQVQSMRTLSNRTRRKWKRCWMPRSSHHGSIFFVSKRVPPRGFRQMPVSRPILHWGTAQPSAVAPGWHFHFSGPWSLSCWKCRCSSRNVGLAALHGGDLAQPAAISHARTLLRHVAEVGGVVSISWHTHPEAAGALPCYQALLATVAEQGGWGCSLGELNDWWRFRRQRLLASPPSKVNC